MRRVNEQNVLTAGQGSSADYPDGLAEDAVRFGGAPERTWFGETTAGRFRIVRLRDFAWVEFETEQAAFVDEEPRFRADDGHVSDVVVVQGLAAPTSP